MTEADRIDEEASSGKPLGPWKIAGFFIGLGLFGLLWFMPQPEGMSAQAQRLAAIAVLMAAWWISEPIPIPATSLIPIFAFPLAGIMDGAKVCLSYGEQNIFLFMGGFFIAMAMQKWNLHKRIALYIILLVGTKPRRIVLGFMTASAFLSMWVSNTATTMMMLPIAMAVVLQIMEQPSSRASEEAKKNFGQALMLAIAYAASIGGVGTLVGTPPNIVFAGAFKNLFPQAPQFTFFQWMVIGVPLVVIFLPIAWLYLTRVACPLGGVSFVEGGAIIREELRKLGPIGRGEACVLAVFVATALLWVFRVNIDCGAFVIPGWSNLLGIEKRVGDGTVAIFSATVMFSIPVDRKRGEFLLDWEWARRIPWGVLLLFGGGFALAAGFTQSGLADWVGGQLRFFSHMPVVLVVALVSVMLCLLTEFTSNTAIATTFMPILAATAVAIRVHPFLLMIPATVSASWAFMLPVATPPNAIVYGSGHVTIAKMVRTGFWLEVIGVAVTVLVVYLILMPLLGINPHEMPPWAAGR